MNRLFRVLHQWKCKDAAQKLALDALRRLGDDSGRRAGLFLWHVEPYLRGVDAPEAEFRDPTNHVLYPVEGWGGAARLARKWYWTTVETLRSRDWPEAAHAAGVLARYAALPFFPLRTGHDETGLALRRPVEWCISRLYDELLRDRDAAKPVHVPDGDDWLERLVTIGAEEARCHFRTVIDRFDFDAVVKAPAALDGELRPVFAALLERSSATVGAILGRAFEESEAQPPRYPIGTAGLFALTSVPLFVLTGLPPRFRERREVRAMHREFAETGRIEATLPDDARTVRDAFELEVLRKPPRRSIEPKFAARTGDAGERVKGRGGERETARRASPEPRPVPRSADMAPLTEASPVAAAPSIGAKLAGRLEAAGVATVGDLLRTDAEQLSAALHPHATAADVATWQDEARLCCGVASLSPAEAQLLVACGVTGPDDLAALSPIELWELVVPVAESPDGRRLLRGGPAPDLDAVTRWIDAAKRPRKAA
ncbi:MAG TPA: DUF4332 domain-containing protein [Planctomycetaceae bacterium]